MNGRTIKQGPDGSRHPKKLVLAMAIGAGLALPMSTHAALEEIVVTAERRETTVQDIPISMTAFNSAQLDKKAVTRLDDLQFASPSLSIADAGLTQSVNIRGIGLASGDPDVTNGVATYVDGLFQPPIVTSSSFYDIADVQVLRGPQGTFSGANSTGGAIFINSQMPYVGEGFDGYIQVGAGNYEARNAQGAVNIPVSDTFAMRAAFNYRERDSFYDNAGPADTDAGSLDERAGRLTALWQPTEQFEAHAKVEYLSKDSGGYAYRPTPTTTYSAGRVGDIRDLNYNTDTRNDEEAKTAMLDWRYEFASGVAIKSITGFQNKQIDNLYDTDGTTLAVSSRDQFVEEEQWSQELNLLSPTDGDFQWVVGAYWQRNEVNVEISDRPAPPLNILIGNEKTITGLFGQVSYDLSDSLQLEVGVRQAWFEADNDPASGVFIGGNRISAISGSYESDDLMGKIALNWKVDYNNLVYAFVARGWKPGGVNSAVSTFDDETVTDYEAGWKSTMFDGQLRTNVGVFYMDYSGFQNTALELSTGRPDVTNVGEATIKGIELSGDVAFGELRIDAAFSYVDSELDQSIALVNTRLLPGTNLGPQCSPGGPTVCFDYSPYLLATSGGPNLLSPEITYNIGVEYSFQVGAYTLTPRLNYAWVDDQYTSLFYNETTDKLESRGLLSALLTLDAESWQLQAYGRNLTNKKYVSGQSVDFNSDFYGSPREFGVNLTYHF